MGTAATVAIPSGNCAGGWSSCAASVGGNCCPSGWECGTASCSSISPTQTAVAQKGSPQKSGAGYINIGEKIWTMGRLLLVLFVLV